MRTEAYQLFTLETVTRLVDGGKAGAESSINKIWWSELDVELHEIALDLIGADVEPPDGVPLCGPEALETAGEIAAMCASG